MEHHFTRSAKDNCIIWQTKETSKNYEFLCKSDFYHIVALCLLKMYAILGFIIDCIRFFFIKNFIVEEN